MPHDLAGWKLLKTLWGLLWVDGFKKLSNCE
jgi:hypothetical protein